MIRIVAVIAAAVFFILLLFHLSVIIRTFLSHYKKYNSLRIHYSTSSFPILTSRRYDTRQMNLSMTASHESFHDSFPVNIRRFPQITEGRLMPHVRLGFVCSSNNRFGFGPRRKDRCEWGRLIGQRESFIITIWPATIALQIFLFDSQELFPPFSPIRWLDAISGRRICVWGAV